MKSLSIILAIVAALCLSSVHAFTGPSFGLFAPRVSAVLKSSSSLKMSSGIE